MKQTVLYRHHLQLSAKMTDFQGWQVPLQYRDVLEEHHAVRAAAGLFDISYLSRIEVSGAGASALLQNTFTRNILKMPEGTAHYGLFCNETGGILNDGLVYHLTENRYLVSANAVNAEKTLLWLSKHANDDVRVTDITRTVVQFSLQGPLSPRVLEKLMPSNGKKFKPRTVRVLTMLDTSVVVSRTGYTGERGYEFFMPAERAEVLWDAIMSAGNDAGILPCGIASRDILRQEMGYLLYGNDLNETRNPLEAGLASYVDFKKDFIGKAALLKIQEEGTNQKLVGFILLDKGAPKAGGSIFSENHEIGLVTSGCLSPSVYKGIGLGYVVSRYAQGGQEIEIEVKDREISARIVTLPFYKKK